MTPHTFQPGDKVRVLEDPGLGVPEGSVGTVQDPAYRHSQYVRVTFSDRASYVPFLPHELEPA